MEKEDEPDHHKVFQLQEALVAEQIEIRLLALWRYEVGNVLRLIAYDFEEVPLRTDYALAVLEYMAAVKGVTFYDSAYHVLAIRTKGLYLTADKAYVKRATRKGHVALLSEWDGTSSAR